MTRRTTSPRQPAGPPEDADVGAAWTQSLLVEAFDRQDGTGADWPLMLESLFRFGFRSIDRHLQGPAREKLLRRIEVSLYNRLAGNLDENKIEPSVTSSPSSNTQDLKSSLPGPLK